MTQFLKDLSVFCFYDFERGEYGWGYGRTANTTQNGSTPVLTSSNLKQHKTLLTTTLLTTLYTNTTQHNTTLQ